MNFWCTLLNRTILNETAVKHKGLFQCFLVTMDKPETCLILFHLRILEPWACAHTSSASTLAFEVWTKKLYFIGYENNERMWARIAPTSIEGQGTINLTPLPSGILDSIDTDTTEKKAFYVATTKPHI